MEGVDNNIFLSTTLTSLHLKRKVWQPLTILAKRRNLSKTLRTQQQPIFPLKVPNPILARSIVAVLGLGFIDAGYSGDWSRIGVISKESEDLLKFAAYLVVPLCVAFILSISKEEEEG